jgi:hypothetical protein
MGASGLNTVDFLSKKFLRGAKYSIYVEHTSKQVRVLHVIPNKGQE